MYKEFGISEEILKKACEVERELTEIFKNLDQVVKY